MNGYVKDAITTESIDFLGISERLHSIRTIRLLHATMGLATEAGEALDVLKKHIFYNRVLDVPNLQEELGDIFWYAAILADACDFTFEDTMEKNVAKLKARYPRRFSERDAAIRDLELERRIIEGKNE